MPAHIFEYDRLPEYADLPAAAQWYAWVCDVKNAIAAEYGIDGRIEREHEAERMGVMPFILPDEWDEQMRSIIGAAFTVWYRKARLDREPSFHDSPHGYKWMREAMEELAAAIESREPVKRDYRADFATEYPEYAEREQRDRQEQAMAAGRLF